MLITAVCPQCDTQYQVQDSLRGKSMRCNVVTCKKVFVVGAPPTSRQPAQPATPARPAADSGRQQTGSVGDLIPLLPVSEADPPRPAGQHVSDVLPFLQAEAFNPELVPVLEPVEPDPQPSTSNWMDAPPPRRGNGKAPPKEEPVAAPPDRKTHRPHVPVRDEIDPAKPRVVGPGAWDAAPPPRRKGREDTDVLPPSTRSRPREADAEVHEPEREPAPARELYDPIPEPRGRWARWIVWPFVGMVFLVLVGGGVALFILFAKNEEKLAREADEAYTTGLFRRAGELYTYLANHYPDSEKLAFYQFRKELAGIRHTVSEKPESPLESFDRLEQFMKDHENNPLRGEYGGDIHDALIKLLLDYCETAEPAARDEALKVLARAAPVIAQAKAIKQPKGAPPGDWAPVDGAFARVRQAVALRQQKESILERLRALPPAFHAILEAEQIVADEAPKLPGLAELPEVKQAIERLFNEHAKNVAYIKEPVALKPKRRGEEEEPALLFDLLVEGAPGNAPPGDPIVLALARGVLYAQKQSTGRVQWAVRVGIDTTSLPVRVPARIGSEERILVLSSDTATLAALNTDGKTLWRYPLDAPSLGKPVVVGQRAYLATVNGDVHEIELARGLLLGRYRLGQRLTLGGVQEPGTNRVYFPADEGCVYVLNVAEQRCEMVLYSRHPGGSLRGEPVIVPPVHNVAGGEVVEVAPGFLILNQTNGLREMQLRVFKLPLEDRRAADRPLEKARLEGWTWFKPYTDPEKLVMLSDAGVLGLFGIRQAGNGGDQALFPLLPGGGLALRPLLNPGVSAIPERIYGRAEVVQVQGDDFWVLAANRLQRLRLAWGAAVGPRVIPAWPEPLLLGSPLHRSQIVEDRVGRTSLVLVTQPARRSTCWATCVDDKRGAVRWKRQLGVVCAQAPLALQTPGRPLFLAVDQGGALLSLDPAGYVVKGGEVVESRGAAFVADSLDENPEQGPSVLLAEDGKSAHVVLCPRGGRELVVRHVQPAAGRRLQVSEGKVQLPAPLGGTPAVIGKHLVVPMTNGVIARLPLPLPAAAAAEQGPDWRHERAAPDSRGHVTALGDDRFLTTNGGRGLTCWQWPVNQDATGLPAGKDPPTLELGDRIVSAPLRLPAAPGAPVQVCVADSGGRVSLIEVQGNGDLQVKRTWDVGGGVTTGPFLQTAAGGVRIGCVVEVAGPPALSRLVWINPAGKPIAWQHDAKGDAIVGRPRLAAGMVVVAYLSGRYVGLDPATGKPVGEGFVLRGSVAPVASPVEFMKGRLLAPLSDGTILLLGAERLRKK